MNDRTVLSEVRKGVCSITLNRPDSLNAFVANMHAELREALDAAEQATEVRVVVLTGAGRAFCAGQDLAERKRGPADPPFDLAINLEKLWGPLVRRLVSMPKPVIAAVNGVAAGAGANLALACDLVIARRSARFIQSFVNIGLMPDCGGTWHLPRMVGMPRALGFMMTGEPVSAEQAAEWGMIWKVVDDDRFEAELAALAGRLAALPGLSLAAIKQAARGAFERTLGSQLDLERDLQQALGFSDDYAEGVAAFGAKRAPVFTGR